MLPDIFGNKKSSATLTKEFKTLRKNSYSIIPDIFSDDEFNLLNRKLEVIENDEDNYRLMSVEGSVRYKIKRSCNESLLAIPSVASLIDHSQLFTKKS